MQTLAQRIEALPPIVQSAILGYLEYLEWKNKNSVGAYSTASSDEDDRGRGRRRDLGQRLLCVRTTLRQSIAEAADVAGVTPSTYEAYEIGRIGRWSSRKVTDYAEAWNVSLDWLMRGEGTMFREGGAPAIEPTETVAAPTPRRKPNEPAASKRAETNLVEFSNFRRYRRTD